MDRKVKIEYGGDNIFKNMKSSIGSSSSPSSSSSISKTGSSSSSSSSSSKNSSSSPNVRNIPHSEAPLYTGNSSGSSSGSTTTINFGTIINYAITYLPFLCFLSCIFALTGSSDDSSYGFWQNTTFYLCFLMHILRVIYVTVRFGSNRSSSPLYNYWMHPDLHYISVFVVFKIMDVFPFLFVVSYLILTFKRMFEVIKREIAPKCGSSRKTVEDICNTVIEFKQIDIVHAIAELVFFGYFILYAFVKFRMNIWGAFVVYAVFFILYRYATNNQHRTCWNWLSKQFVSFYSKNYDSFGKYLAEVRNFFVKVGDIAETIYPVD